MAGARPFLPMDKPRSWVVFNLAVLVGLALGLLGAAAAWLNLAFALSVLETLFFACWLVAAISWLGFRLGMSSGRYHNLPARPWREQVW